MPFTQKGCLPTISENAPELAGHALKVSRAGFLPKEVGDLGKKLRGVTFFIPPKSSIVQKQAEYRIATGLPSEKWPLFTPLTKQIWGISFVPFRESIFSIPGHVSLRQEQCSHSQSPSFPHQCEPLFEVQRRCANTLLEDVPRRLLCTAPCLLSSAATHPLRVR